VNIAAIASVSLKENFDSSDSYLHSVILKSRELIDTINS